MLTTKVPLTVLHEQCLSVPIRIVETLITEYIQRKCAKRRARKAIHSEISSNLFQLKLFRARLMQPTPRRGWRIEPLRELVSWCIYDRIRRDDSLFEELRERDRIAQIYEAIRRAVVADSEKRYVLSYVNVAITAMEDAVREDKLSRRLLLKVAQPVVREELNKIERKRSRVTRVFTSMRDGTGRR